MVKEIIKQNLNNLSVHKELENKNIYLFGYNMYVEYINNCLYSEGYRLSGIIDNDKTKQGKIIYDILIYSPESICWDKNDIVIIASSHWRQMKKQIQNISDKIKVFILADVVKCIEKEKKREEFWSGDTYQSNVMQLYRGEKVYGKLKQGEKLVVVLSALGDIFAVGIYFQAYKEKMEGLDIKIVIASKAIYKVAKLFGFEKIEMITEDEIDALCKYMLFSGMKEDIVCTCIFALDEMARYKKIEFPRFWAKYYFRLDNGYRVDFPSIWDEALNEEELADRGLVKGKTIILAPYANSVEMLPFQFWELLAEKLLDAGFHVFTNVAGSQRPVSKTEGIELPFKQIGNYLEFAGYFISLRSGLCDVVGRAKCKQIIIFRDRRYGFHGTQISMFDLHSENVSENAIQYIYDDERFANNVDEVEKLLLDT